MNYDDDDDGDNPINVLRKDAPILGTLSLILGPPLRPSMIVSISTLMDTNTIGRYGIRITDSDRDTFYGWRQMSYTLGGYEKLQK